MDAGLTPAISYTLANWISTAAAVNVIVLGRYSIDSCSSIYEIN